jgi:hypothetical protein
MVTVWLIALPKQSPVSHQSNFMSGLPHRRDLRNFHELFSILSAKHYSIHPRFANDFTCWKHRLSDPKALVLESSRMSENGRHCQAS